MIYFYYGKNAYLVREEERRIRDKYEGTHALSCADADEKDVSVDYITSLLGAQDLFSPQRLVVARDFFTSFDAREQAALLSFLGELNHDQDVIVFSEASIPRKNGKLFKWLLENATSQEVVVPAGIALERWIQDYAKKQGGVIDSKAVYELSVRYGDQIALMAREVEKLCAFKGVNPATIDDVKLLTRSRAGGDIFKLLELVTSGRTGQALVALRQQVRAGDDPHYIFSMFVYQLRTLLSVASLYHEGGIRDKMVIAKTLKIHPFVAQKSMVVLNSLTTKQLTKMYYYLRESDEKMKLGRADVELVMERLIIKR